MTLIYPPPVGGASAEWVPPNSIYSMLQWQTSGPSVVVIPLPIRGAASTANPVAMLIIRTTSGGSRLMSLQNEMQGTSDWHNLWRFYSYRMAYERDA